VGPLSDPEVIRLVSRNFVPVAVNLYKINKAKDAGGKFFQEVRKQRPRQYQGLYIVDYDGKVLSSHDASPGKAGEAGWPRLVRAIIAEGLRAFGAPTPRKVEPFDPLPFRGRGARPDGSAVVAMSARALPSSGPPSHGWVALDSRELSAKEWPAFAPKSAEPGAAWVVPEKTVRKLNAVLSPGIETSSLPTADEIREARLSGAVTEVRGGVAYLRYTGKLSSVHLALFAPHKGKPIRARATLEGVGAYDVAGKRLLSLTILVDGHYRHHHPYDKEERPYVAVIEWRRE
jgi:hypothetical protein